MRGRPPVTRARVLGYWAKHGPCTIAQVVRATGAHRSHVQRILRQSQALIFALSGPVMNSMAFDTYLVGGSSGKGTSDALEQRQAIRQMCGYVRDDSRIASYHSVPLELVASIRAAIPTAKRKGAGRVTVSHHATGADAQNPFHSENRMNEMIRRGSEMLRDRLLEAMAARAA